MAVVVQGERGSEVGVSVTWGLFRAGSGAWATKTLRGEDIILPRLLFLSVPCNTIYSTHGSTLSVFCLLRRHPYPLAHA